MTELSDLFTAYTDKAALEESTKFPTIPTGGYNGKIVDWKLRDAGEKSPYPGRPMIVPQVAVYENGKRIATVFPELSHIPYRVAEIEGKRKSVHPDDAAYDRSLPLDGPFKMWASLSKLV